MGNIYKSSEVNVQCNRYHMSFTEAPAGMDTLEDSKINSSSDNFIVAMRKSENIILDAKKEAARIISEAKKESELIIQKGYEDGKKQGHREYEGKIKETTSLCKEILEEKYIMTKNYEKDIVSLASEISHKIIGHHISANRNTLKVIFENALSKIIEEDYEIISTKMNRKNMSSFYPTNEIEEFMIKIKCDKKMTDTQCIVETENGEIDISINSQLKEITKKLISVAG